MKHTSKNTRAYSILKLLIFCIKVTAGLKEAFGNSSHMLYLTHLHDKGRWIFSIALTFSNELCDAYNDGVSLHVPFQEYFKNEVASWRLQINTVL